MAYGIILGTIYTFKFIWMMLKVMGELVWKGKWIIISLFLALYTVLMLHQGGIVNIDFIQKLIEHNEQIREEAEEETTIDNNVFENETSVVTIQ